MRHRGLLHHTLWTKKATFRLDVEKTDPKSKER